MKKTTILVATCALLAAVGEYRIAGAQGASTSAGVYTAEQAKRGAGLYKEQCAACHGEDLKGNDIIPGLIGDSFATNWTGKTLGDLYEKIELTMPALNPGSLKPEQTADLIAHVLSTAKYPAGSTALPTTMDALAKIKIDAAK